MANRKKKDNLESNEIKKLDVNYINENVAKEAVPASEDNPLSKKVSTIIDKVSYNKNNEVLLDSDLVGNIIL